MALIEGTSWDGKLSSLTLVTLVGSSGAEKSGSGLNRRSKVTTRAKSEQAVTKIASSFMPHMPALAALFGSEDD